MNGLFIATRSATRSLLRNSSGSCCNLQHVSADLAADRNGKGLLRSFKVRIHAVDSTVIELVANCMDRAKHRRCKTFAKMHLLPDLLSSLPSFAIVDTAGQHSSESYLLFLPSVSNHSVAHDGTGWLLTRVHSIGIMPRCSGARSAMFSRTSVETVSYHHPTLSVS